MPRRTAALVFAALVALTQACSRSSQRPEITKTNLVDSGARARWPKSARLAATEAQLSKLAAISGITIEDHAQRKLGDGRWEVSVQVAGDKAAEELRRHGFAPELRDPVVIDPDSVPR